MSRKPLYLYSKESVVEWWKNYFFIKNFRKEEAKNPDDPWYDELEAMKPRWRQFNFLELYSIFPEAKSLITKQLKKEKSELNNRINELSEIYRYEKNQEGIAPVQATRELFAAWADETNQMIQKMVRKEKRISFYLYAILHPSQKGDTSSYRNIDKMILEAKEVPIESLYDGALRKNHLTFSGKCEFHEDKSPSLVIYTNNNRWWCFAEQRGGDSIDYAMEKYHYSFKDAITFLCQK